MKSAITVESLKKNYGQTAAVKEISFSVPEGSFFAFLGENGAGKTTTINILCTILAKDSGRVEVAGIDLDSDPYGIKKNIGIVFQGSVLDARLTVMENLAVRASFYGLSGAELNARIEGLEQFFNIKELLKRAYGKLSGGQKRRIDIVRALLNKPKVLFLDEPTTGLDPNTRSSVYSAISEMRKKDGLTIFLTTHYMEETQAADKVVIIDGGKIVESGSPSELKVRHSGDFIKLFNSPKLCEYLSAHKIDFVSESDKYIIKKKNSSEVKKFLAEHGDAIGEFEVIKGNMDDVFLAVTGKVAGD